MPFSPELAEIRFGCGLSPIVPPVSSPEAMLAGLTDPDRMMVQFPIETFDVFRQRMVAFRVIHKKMRETIGTPEYKVHRKQRNALNKATKHAMARWYGRTVLRWTYSQQGFHERLASFWGDHFTARGKTGLLRRAASPYHDDAIRPHIAGTFGDLLVACITHPLMLHYLDQDVSVGPNSRRAKRKKRTSGLNENLAREVLELHTLGVDGPYTQRDVRQLAELFTGLTARPKGGFKFRKDFAEPGSETVLGKTYGGDPGRLGSVIEALQDLAVHPATARNIAWKLAVHFVADVPDVGLVDHITARFQQTGGDLLAVYAALLEHPAAWDARLQNVKPPADFIGSSLRALVIPIDSIEALDARLIGKWLTTPMALMGQPWQKPGGPDGWPEEDSAWITPQGMAARVRWAMSVPQMLHPNLPDPRRFVQDALGARARGAVQFVARAAESKAEAIGLVLASPAFQRR